MDAINEEIKKIKAHFAHLENLISQNCSSAVATNINSKEPAGAVNTSGSLIPGTSASRKNAPFKRKRNSVATIKTEVNDNVIIGIKDKKDAENRRKKAKIIEMPQKIKEVPAKLSAKEQATADAKSRVHFQKGARVFAIWGKQYYSAICDNADGLGRYKVFYTDNQSARFIPRAGIIPIYLIKEESQVSVLGERDEDGEEIIYEGKVLEIPSINNIQEWLQGIYKIEVKNEEYSKVELREIQWFNIFFTAAQYKQIIKTVKNPTAIDQENVIQGGRRSRC